jgi:hypothetical protein
MKRLPALPRLRFGLLARFALASFVAVALLGVALAHTFDQGVSGRSSGPSSGRATSRAA